MSVSPQLDNPAVVSDTMSMTTTRTVDKYGNVIYLVHDGDREVGQLQKASRGYVATLPNGDWTTAGSIKGGAAWLARWAR